jgi:ABC-type anion transport system duplicated permease subunit
MKDQTTVILSGKATLALLLCLLIVGICTSWYSRTLDEVMAADRSTLKSLIDADAALTGFVGLIVVYILNSNRDTVRRAEENIHTEELSKQKQLRRRILDSEETKTLTPMVERSFQHTRQLYDWRISRIQKQIRRIQQGSVDTVIIMALTLVLLVVSIFATLLAMGNIDPFWRSAVVTFSIAPIPIVLMLLFLAIFFHAKEIFIKTNTGASSQNAKQPIKPKPKQNQTNARGVH